ncbi:MAG: hypothetical protein HYV63_25080 [Candidatus Schekmanbacteria bacterium]|nr:hypothetical protein [Candidatus Schekmanbacteria bacterium]
MLSHERVRLVGIGVCLMAVVIARGSILHAYSSPDFYSYSVNPLPAAKDEQIKIAIKGVGLKGLNHIFIFSANKQTCGTMIMRKSLTDPLISYWSDDTIERAIAANFHDAGSYEYCVRGYLLSNTD